MNPNKAEIMANDGNVNEEEYHSTEQSIDVAVVQKMKGKKTGDSFRSGKLELGIKDIY